VGELKLGLFLSLFAAVSGCQSPPSLKPDATVVDGPAGPGDVGVGTDRADVAVVDVGPDASEEVKFTRIVSGGIDDRLNGYPWAMELFDGDKDGTPEVYVGTVQNPLCTQTGLIAWFLEPLTPKPPKRWQCRNDLWGDWLAYFAASATAGHVYRGVRDDSTGTFSWTRVFSPAKEDSSGFRGARVFDNALYMLGFNLSGGVVWKSVDGENYVKASPPGMSMGTKLIAGGLRGAQVFKGKLYVANNGICEIYASAAPSTAPGSWGKVNDTGFVMSGGATNAAGKPLNEGIWQLGVFDGQLYAGTTNAEGSELWRSDDPKPGNWTKVIAGGFGNTVPQGFMTVRPYGGHLYLGTVLYPGLATTYEGCDILRVDASDKVELLVGKTRDPGLPSEIAPLSKMGDGFGYHFNVYAWYMAEHKGHLYVGTYDAGSQAIDYAEELFGKPLDEWTETEHGLIDLLLGTSDHARQGGADFYRTKDGISWEALTLDGFGDRDNYGVRNLLDTPWGLMVGVGNAVDGFEIWLGAL
jgi:hypothetical protein